MQKGRADRDAVWSFCDGDRLTWAPKRITWGPGPYPFGGKRQFKGICIRHLLGRKRPCILRVHRRQPTAGSIVPYTGASVSRRGDAGCRYHYCSGLFLFLSCCMCVIRITPEKRCGFGNPWRHVIVQLPVPHPVSLSTSVLLCLFASIPCLT